MSSRSSARPHDEARRALLAGAAVVVVSLGAVVVHLIATGNHELSACDAALAKGDRIGAAAHARRAAAAYVPWAPHVGAAYEALERIARDAELHGDRGAALFAWRAVRTQSIASLAVFSVHAADRKAADRAIARLASRREADSDSDSGPGLGSEPSATTGAAITVRSDRRSVEHEMLAVLSADRGPSRWRVVCMALGFSAWAAGWMALVRGKAAPDPQRKRALGCAALLALVGALAWLLGLGAG